MNTKLKDIAERAQVSTAAVSLALNNKGGVSKRTAERIQKIAKSLNYSAPRNRIESPETIRFIQIESDSPIAPLLKGFIADYIKGLSHAAQEGGYKLEIPPLAGHAPEEVIESLGRDSPAGAVILGAGLWQEDLRRFASVETPLVFIDVSFDYLHLNFVDMNNADSVHKIVSYLVEVGHKNIGIVQSADETPNFSRREKAFGESLALEGLPFDAEHRYVLPRESDAEPVAFERALDKAKELPTALFCVNDTVAYRTLQVLRSRGIKVPEDLSLVGFDNLPTSEYMDPPLTTINIRKDLMGERAFFLLAEQMRLGREKPAETVLLEGELIKRSSVTAPKHRN